MSVGSPGDWNGVYPAVYSNVRTPRAQQSTDLSRVIRGTSSWARDVHTKRGGLAKVGSLAYCLSHCFAFCCGTFVSGRHLEGRE